MKLEGRGRKRYAALMPPELHATVLRVLVTALETIGGELTCIRETMDEIRTDLAWGILNDKFGRPSDDSVTPKTEAQSFPLKDAIAMGLSAEQMQQALDEGVTTVLGLRRIEKNSRKKRGGTLSP